MAPADSSSPRRCAARVSRSCGTKLAEHRAFLERDGLLDERRRQNLAGEVFAVASGRAKRHLEEAVAESPELGALLDAVQRRELDPLTAVREIMVSVFDVDEDAGAPGLAEIEAAQERLAGVARETPVYSVRDIFAPGGADRSG